MDAEVWKRIFFVAASLLLVLLALGSVLYYFSPSLLFQILDPRGITVRQALGSLAATTATAAFVKYIVQYESRAARDQADKSAMEALQTDAAAIVSAYAAVQRFYKDRPEAPTTLVDRAARLLGRKHEIAKGIDRVIWRTLLSIVGSEGINAHLQFLSQMITPHKIEPISRYLQHRANFAFELKQANSDDRLEELFTVLFSGVENLEVIDSPPLVDTRLKAFTVLATMASLLQAMQTLELSIDAFDEVKAQADLAYHRVDRYFEADARDEEAAAAVAG